MQIKFASVIMQPPPPPPRPILRLRLSARRTPFLDGEPITSNDCGTQLRFHRAAIHSLFVLHFLSEFIASFTFKSIPVGGRRNRPAGCS